MPNIFLRIFLVHEIIFTIILLYLVPKKLRAYLPPSWFHQRQHQQEKEQEQEQPPPPPCDQRRRITPASVMDTDELRRVFQMFDRNGDGRITQKELADSLQNIGIFIPEAELAQMISKIDANGDGCVDIDEFGALYKSIMDEQREGGCGGDDDPEEDMKEAFNVFDQNGDGFISVEELKSVLVSLGLKQGRTVEDCRKMIMKVDVDGDGMVNYNEFKQMMRGGGFAALS